MFIELHFLIYLNNYVVAKSEKKTGQASTLSLCFFTIMNEVEILGVIHVFFL